MFEMKIFRQQPEDKTFPSTENLVNLEGTKCRSYWLSDSKIFCEPDRLSEENLELPRINYDQNGKEYRYVYGVNQLEGYAETNKVTRFLDSQSRVWTLKLKCQLEIGN